MGPGPFYEECDGSGQGSWVELPGNWDIFILKREQEANSEWTWVVSTGTGAVVNSRSNEVGEYLLWSQRTGETNSHLKHAVKITLHGSVNTEQVLTTSPPHKQGYEDIMKGLFSTHVTGALSPFHFNLCGLFRMVAQGPAISSGPNNSNGYSFLVKRQRSSWNLWWNRSLLISNKQMYQLARKQWMVQNNQDFTKTSRKL